MVAPAPSLNVCVAAFAESGAWRPQTRIVKVNAFALELWIALRYSR